MLDFDTAWAEQENIPKLVRPVDPTGFEVYWPNENYGFSLVLKAYAGCEPEMPVMAIIPHGVYLFDQVGAQEAKVKLPSVLNYPEYLDEPWRRARKTVVPMASPFLYARELMRKRGVLRENVERKGTLFMPFHSTKGATIDTDTERVAEKLLALPEQMQPVTVCAHWYDYSKGLHKPFEDRGFPIVCAGSLHDPMFLVRLIHLMSSFAYVGANGLGSSLFYAAALGIEPFMLDVEYSIEFVKGFEDSDMTPERQQEVDDLEKLFARLDEDARSQKSAMAEYLLRADELKSPEGLLEDLQYVQAVARHS